MAFYHPITDDHEAPLRAFAIYASMSATYAAHNEIFYDKYYKQIVYKFERTRALIAVPNPSTTPQYTLTGSLRQYNSYPAVTTVAQFAALRQGKRYLTDRIGSIERVF